MGLVVVRPPFKPHRDTGVETSLGTLPRPSGAPAFLSGPSGPSLGSGPVLPTSWSPGLLSLDLCGPRSAEGVNPHPLRQRNCADSQAKESEFSSRGDRSANNFQENPGRGGCGAPEAAEP